MSLRIILRIMYGNWSIIIEISLFCFYLVSPIFLFGDSYVHVKKTSKRAETKIVSSLTVKSLLKLLQIDALTSI